MIKFVTHAAAGLLILGGKPVAETTTPTGQTVMGSTTFGREPEYNAQIEEA
jgi:hypothetical protein